MVIASPKAPLTRFGSQYKSSCRLRVHEDVITGEAASLVLKCRRAPMIDV